MPVQLAWAVEAKASPPVLSIEHDYTIHRCFFFYSQFYSALPTLNYYACEMPRTPPLQLRSGTSRKAGRGRGQKEDRKVRKIKRKS
mmetsp:Transcript_47177/g.121938  ORF Transcript_47177/g.121938 Transcript_47177/m.121938 type:complete len:86 (+) Transcript_47177:5717-5974(+)